MQLQPRLLPDGTPDVHYRTACGGQKLRDIMLQGYIDLYGPYVSAAPAPPAISPSFILVPSADAVDAAAAAAG